MYTSGHILNNSRKYYMYLQILEKSRQLEHSKFESIFHRSWKRNTIFALLVTMDQAGMVIYIINDNNVVMIEADLKVRTMHMRKSTVTVIGRASRPFFAIEKEPVDFVI